MNAHEIALQFQQEVLQTLKSLFVAKNEIIDVLGVALVAGENVFLHGPPGTAKSALVRELGQMVQGHTFEYLLTRFTEPNELFGPFDIRRLRDGDLVTNTAGMLPEADLVFLDELLNANSAILNSLLAALNERVFRRGQEVRRLPALMFVGASNHLPEEDSLRALFDRFLLRIYCGNVPEEMLGQVLAAGRRLDARREIPAVTGISAGAVRTMQQGVQTIDFTAIEDACVAMIRRLRAAGLAVSDRRAVKLQRVIAASALLCGRKQAKLSDLWVLRYIWDNEEQREWLTALVDETLRAADPAPDDHPRALEGGAPDPEQLAGQIESIEADLRASEPSAGREALKDRLVGLGHRVEWVKDEAPRVMLRTRVRAIWESIAAPTAP